MIFYMSTTAYAQYAEVEIGGVMYGLNQTTNTATVVNGNTWVPLTGKYVSLLIFLRFE